MTKSLRTTDLAEDTNKWKEWLVSLHSTALTAGGVWKAWLNFPRVVSLASQTATPTARLGLDSP